MAYDEENGTEYRNFYKVSTVNNCNLEVQMLFIKENRSQWLAMGIKDSERKCIPAPITAKFMLSSIVFAGDNMTQGIRALPQAKTEI